MAKKQVKKQIGDISLLIGNDVNLPDGRLAAIYVVLQALKGDKSAIELLDTVDYKMFDADGKQVYPPLPKENPDNPHNPNPQGSTT